MPVKITLEQRIKAFEDFDAMIDAAPPEDEEREFGFITVVGPRYEEFQREKEGRAIEKARAFLADKSTTLSLDARGRRIQIARALKGR